MSEVNDIHIHVHLEPDPRIDRILQMLNQLTTEEKKTMVDLNNLTAEVRANGDAVASAVALIQGLAAQLEAAGTDPVALQELVHQLKNNDTQLANAVVANTPAETVPVDTTQPPSDVPPQDVPQA